MLSADHVYPIGKAEVLQEEMAKCTVEATGVGVMASSERVPEITTGRSCDKQRWQRTAKARLITRTL
jgi:hypothetical protein